MRFALILLTIICASAHSSMILVNGSRVGGADAAPEAGTNDARIDAVIALSANYVEPTGFTLNRPADPVTTATVGGTDADSCAEIQSAVGTAGNEITIPAGTYGSWPSSACDLTINVSDVDVIATGVTINGDLRIGEGGAGTRPARIRWTGGTVNGIFEIEKGTDFLVDNLNSLNDQSVTGQHGNVWTGGAGDGTNPNRQRFAVINSTLDVHNADPGGGWTIFMGAPGSNPPPNQEDSHVDWFMGNVIIRNDPAQNFRVHDFREAVFVGVAWNDEGEFDPTASSGDGDWTVGSTNGPRWEIDILDVYIVDSYAMGSTITDTPTGDTDPMIRFEVLHFPRFHSVQNAFSNWFNQATDTTVDESDYYHRPGTNGSVTGVGGEVALGQATGSGNTIRDTWDGTNADAQSLVADEGLDWITGADH